MYFRIWLVYVGSCKYPDFWCIERIWFALLFFCRKGQLPVLLFFSFFFCKMVLAFNIHLSWPELLRSYVTLDPFKRCGKILIRTVAKPIHVHYAFMHYFHALCSRDGIANHVLFFRSRLSFPVSAMAWLPFSFNTTVLLSSPTGMQYSS